MLPLWAFVAFSRVTFTFTFNFTDLTRDCLIGWHLLQGSGMHFKPQTSLCVCVCVLIATDWLVHVHAKPEFHCKFHFTSESDELKWPHFARQFTDLCSIVSSSLDGPIFVQVRLVQSANLQICAVYSVYLHLRVNCRFIDNKFTLMFILWQDFLSPNSQWTLIISTVHDGSLTFWRRIFSLILAHSVFKMWVIQKPNKVALWNKRHFEEKKMEIIQHV